MVIPNDNKRIINYIISTTVMSLYSKKDLICGDYTYKWMHNLLSNFLIVMLCVHVYVDKNIYEYIRMKEIIEKAEKSFRKASLRDHRMKVVNLVKVNTLSMQWPVPNLVQLYYASVVKSPFKSCILYDSAVHVLQIFSYRNTILLWRWFRNNMLMYMLFTLFRINFVLYFFDCWF